MNSPRKYRGIRVDNGEWAKGWYFPVSDKHYILPANKGRILPLGYTDGPPTLDGFIEVHPETVGQYAGLKDSEGVEGYYQDITEDTNGDRYEVAWDEDDATYYLRATGLDVCDKELRAIKKQRIIGNIPRTRNYWSRNEQRRTTRTSL